jgi:hypothetical protein
VTDRQLPVSWWSGPASGRLFGAAAIMQAAAGALEDLEMRNDLPPAHDSAVQN